MPHALVNENQSRGQKLEPRRREGERAGLRHVARYFPDRLALDPARGLKAGRIYCHLWCRTRGIDGGHVPQDPHAQDKLAKVGQIAFDFGKFWLKGQRMGTGLTRQ